MQRAHEDHRKLEPLGGMDGHHANHVAGLGRRRFGDALGPPQRFQIFEQLRQRPRTIAKLAPQPRQQLFDVGAGTIWKSGRVAALIQRHRDQTVRGYESSEFTNSPEPSFKLGPPAFATHLIDLVIAQAHQRPAQHADQRDLIQRIHQRGQEREQIARFARFQKCPAAGEQERNVQTIESPLEGRSRAERAHQNGDIAVFELAAVDELPDSRSYQIRLRVRGMLSPRPISRSTATLTGSNFACASSGRASIPGWPSSIAETVARISARLR